MHRRPEYLCMLAALLALLPGVVPALSTDRDQPIEIEANHVSLDDPGRLATYTGDVVLTQGSIEAHGDQLIIHMSPTDEIERIVMTGEPATFRQLTDDGEEVYGEGLRMEYREREAYLKIEKEGLLRRGLNVFRGPLIEFDLAKEVVTASSVEENTQRQRVHITIQPDSVRTPAGDEAAKDRP